MRNQPLLPEQKHPELEFPQGPAFLPNNANKMESYVYSLFYRHRNYFRMMGASPKNSYLLFDDKHWRQTTTLLNLQPHLAVRQQNRNEYERRKKTLFMTPGPWHRTPEMKDRCSVQTLFPQEGIMMADMTGWNYRTQKDRARVHSTRAKGETKEVERTTNDAIASWQSVVWCGVSPTVVRFSFLLFLSIFFSNNIPSNEQ